jgi:hypothetical protein
MNMVTFLDETSMRMVKPFLAETSMRMIKPP